MKKDEAAKHRGQISLPLYPVLTGEKNE